MNDEVATTVTWPPVPYLRYTMWGYNKRYDNGNVRIARAQTVSAQYDGERFTVTVNGKMLTKAGRTGPVRRAEVDLMKPQPDWLDDIIDDAARRLGVA